ncbi:hypothetical protein E2I00_019645, partial [Balaenoptera physalus]
NAQLTRTHEPAAEVYGLGVPASRGGGTEARDGTQSLSPVATGCRAQERELNVWLRPGLPRPQLLTLSALTEREGAAASRKEGGPTRARDRGTGRVVLRGFRIACLFRVNALSLVYLLFLLLLPWFPGPSRHSIQGHTGRLLRVLLGFSLLFLAAHLTLQICLHTMPHLDQLLGPSCSTWDTISRHIGVTRLDLKDVPSAIRLVAPDLGVLAASSLCLGVCRRRTQMARRSQRAQEPDDDDGDVDAGSLVGLQEAPALPRKRRSWLASRFRITAHWLLVAAGRTLAVVLLALAGIAHPSAFSSVYFLLFLTICTWWACHFPISPLGFSALCVMVGCFGTGHLLCLYCYQTPLAQSMLPPASIWARVFGLKDFVAPANCSSPNVLVLNTSHDWPVYGKEAAGDDEEREVELTEVDRWPQGQARAAATKEEEATQDNCIVHDLTGHSAVPQRPCEYDAAARLLPPAHPRLSGLKETSPLHGLGHLVMDQSYVCALIAMMVWSITYHSWLTFVLLLWACLIWTPELPTALGPVSLRQLGLEHTRYPCLDLGAMVSLLPPLERLLGDLGLEQFSVSELFSSILEGGLGRREPGPLPLPWAQALPPEAAQRQSQEDPSPGSLCPHPGHLVPLCRPQICFLMAVNVIGQRMNFMVILHGCWLVAILTRRRREAIARLWPNYCLFLALFLLYQYLLCLGIPPALCIGEQGGLRAGVGAGAPNATNLISESPGAPRAHAALLAVREAVRVPAGLVCTVKGYYNPKEMLGRDQDCLLPVEEAGVLWRFGPVVATALARGCVPALQLLGQRLSHPPPHLLPLIHSGDYFLFESDSEEEEAAQPEDPRPSAQSAFQKVRGGRVLSQGPGLQMAYQAWVTNAQTVLHQQRRERAEQLPTGRSHVMRRALSTMQLLWVLGQALGRALRLLEAVYQCVAAHSELLCYFVIILNHMVTASTASLVLPVLVFLWATLSIPRPSKRFWMTAIVFTEVGIARLAVGVRVGGWRPADPSPLQVTVVAKYLFQFGFFPWNSHAVLRRYENKPYFPPRILGLEKSDSYVKYDLLQLMVLFFHRAQLLRQAGRRDAQHGPGHLARSVLPNAATPASSPAPHLSPQCYGLWDHDGDPLSKEHDRGGGKDKGAEEEPALLGPHGEPGAARAPTEDDIPVEAKDAPPEPRDERRVSLHLRRRRKESTEPRGRAATEGEDGKEVGAEAAAAESEKRRSRPRERGPEHILADDQVPEAFLVMLLIQFGTMVVDRALYLRKTVLGKLAFQVVLVLAVHLWMFFILPAVPGLGPCLETRSCWCPAEAGLGRGPWSSGLETGTLTWLRVPSRMFSQNAVAQLWYFVKCIYFALSAYQIRCGYPTRILGNFLTKKFRLVPFLVELRAVMDWVWTDTTLSLSNWMCVEDIYANIFIIKCSRETEKPTDVTVTLKLGGYEPLFTMSAQQPSIVPFTHQAYEELSKQFDPHPLAMQFISQYGPEDIVTAQIEGSSGALWRISPPSRAQMKRELYNGTADITLRFTWNFQRERVGSGAAGFLEWWVIELQDCQADCNLLPMELPCVDRILKLCQDIFLTGVTGQPPILAFLLCLG